jgi:hypothetical protein
VWVVQVIPPPGYCARRSGYSLEGSLGDLRVKNPIKQVIAGSQGLYSVMNMTQRSLPLRAFAALANQPHNQPLPKLANDPDALERTFWYGIPSEGSGAGAGRAAARGPGRLWALGP